MKRRSAAAVTSDAVRAAQIAAGAQVYQTTADLVKDLAKNPIVELVVSFVLIEKLQQRGLLSQVLGTAMEAGIAGIVTAQQIAPLMPAIAGSAQGLTGALAGVAALAAPGPP